MIVAIVPSILLRPSRPAPQGGQPEAPGGPALSDSARDTAAPAPARLPVARPPDRPDFRRDTVRSGEQFVTVESPLYRYLISTAGGRLAGATLKQYRSFAPADSGAPVQLLPSDSRFLSYQMVFGRDTVNLADWSLAPSDTLLEVGAGESELTLRGERGGLAVELRYRFAPDGYVFDVQGVVRAPGQAGGLLLITMAPELRMVESDSVDDRRSYSVVTKASSTEKVDLNSLDPGERRIVSGPFEWVALKSKYFLFAVLTIDGAQQLGGVALEGGPRSGKQASRVMALASLPAAGGVFQHSVYAGPQEYQRLSAVGHDLNDVNPYGWIFRPIIQPFSVLIVWILLWMHDTLLLGYGWVLVLFGILVRVLLWPLNQKAMKSTMAMQAIAPEVKMIQDKYRKDPQKMQQEVMAVYRRHNVSPLGGCLPMLIPMPVLFALFFVFANTIEFRGVPFLWLPDLSRADPLYIIPILMGLSMYVVSKIGQVGMPPNPQATMMLYVMPVMFTVLFLNFSSGLNLYYAVSNIASIPQQWLISRERLRRIGKPAS